MAYSFNQQGSLRWAVASAIASAVLVACGGGGTTGQALTGKVMDGYIKGAIVCLDVNNNGVCNSDEPQTETTAGGAYTLDVPSDAQLGGTNLLVNVPVGAIDEDTGAAVTTAFAMRGFANSASVVSPLTTAVVARVDAGMTLAQASAAVASDLGLTGTPDLMADYVAAQSTSLHNVARVLARSFQETGAQTSAQLTAALPGLSSVTAQAFAQATALDESTLEGLVSAWKTQTQTSPVAVSFASGYAAVDAASVGYAYQGLSTEGGAFNWTVADGSTYGWDGADFWWSGIATEDATPNFYWGGKGKSNQDYMESWVNAPANGTLTLSGQTTLRLVVWGNDELVGAPRFTPVIQLAESNGCYPRAEAAPITPTAAGADAGTHDVSLSDFTVVENCGTEMTTAEFMAEPIASVRVRIYKANYYNGGGVDASPNGINLGPISFTP